MNATQIITEIRNGELAKELSLALSEALRSVQDVGKGASVNLKIEIKPLTKMKMTEPAVGYSGEVICKPAKPELEETIMFIGIDGEPTKQPSRQPELGLKIAGSEAAQ